MTMKRTSAPSGSTLGANSNAKRSRATLAQQEQPPVDDAHPKPARRTSARLANPGAASPSRNAIIPSSSVIENENSRRGKATVKPLVDFSADSTLFPLIGSKAGMLERPELRVPLLAAASSDDVTRVIECFTGTAAMSLFLARNGLLPEGSILNELMPYRNYALDHVYCLDHAAEVAAEADRLLEGAFQIACKVSKGLEDDPELTDEDLEELAAGPDVSKEELSDWAGKARIDERTGEVCTDLIMASWMREAAKGWQHGEDSPDNTVANAALSIVMQHHTVLSDCPGIHPVSAVPGPQTDLAEETGLAAKATLRFNWLGTPWYQKRGEGRVQIDEGRRGVKKDIETTAPLLQGLVRVLRGDGFEAAKKSEKGHLTLMDPVYMVEANQNPRDAVTYMPVKVVLPEQTAEGAFRKMAELAPAWQRGARFIVMNRQNKGFVTRMKNMGWEVSKPFIVKERSTLQEIVAVNFKAEQGAQILPLGTGVPVESLGDPKPFRALPAAFASVPAGVTDDGFEALCRKLSDPSAKEQFAGIFKRRIFGPLPSETGSSGASKSILGENEFETMARRFPFPDALSAQYKTAVRKLIKTFCPTLVDDASGRTWKAISPVDEKGRIDRAKLDRLIESAEADLEKPDPKVQDTQVSALKKLRKILEAESSSSTSAAMSTSAAGSASASTDPR